MIMEWNKTYILILLFSVNILLSGCGGGSSSPPTPPPPPAKGEVTVTITGVPTDVEADVILIQVLTPVSNIWDVPNSQTFNNLVPGSYSVLAETFSKSLTEYVLDTERRINFEVIAGEKVTIEVDYSTRNITPGTLNLTIDKSLVENGVTVPPILIEGPEGYSQAFSDSTVITGLIPGGSYNVTALDFNAQSQNYGFYVDFFRFGIQENTVLDNNVTIVPIPVRIKSIEMLPQVAISGIPDGQGNFYTVENQPQINRLGVSRHFIHKWDSQGNKIWTTEITGQTYQFWSWKLAVDDVGNVYLVGYEDTGIFVGIQNRNLQAQLYKYNSSGQFVLEKDLPQLFGLELAKAHEMGIQQNKIVIFSTHIPIQGNPSLNTRALISVVDSSNGSVLSTIADSTINDFTQLIPIENQGYWIFATDRIIHYSEDGVILESYFTGDGVEPFNKEITGGVAFQPDPLGGFYVLTTIEGPNDSDIQLSKYDDNFNIVWQQTIINLGRESIEKISYDSVTEKILIQFFTYGNFSNMKGDRVFSEWDSSGQLIWLRQYQGINGLIVSGTRESNNIDWKIIYKTPESAIKGQYGVGNSIIIGP